jgi:hypothetical protein
MVVLLFLLGALINQARQPQMWAWLASDDGGQAAQITDASADDGDDDSAARPWRETIVPGPTDKDPAEWEAIQREFAAVDDKKPLAVEEMAAYWRLMRWGRAQSFDDLRRHAGREVPYKKLFDDAGHFRGKLMTFRMHVRQVVDWDVAEGSDFGTGVERVYEVSGATDQSQSLPFIVVVSELPPGMPRGTKVFEDVTFVGYFLKTMLYTDGLGTQRAAPLLIGRLQWRQNPIHKTRQQARQEFWWPTIIGGSALLVVVVASWWLGSKRRRTRVAMVPPEKEEDAVRRFAEQAASPDETPPEAAS